MTIRKMEEIGKLSVFKKVLARISLLECGHAHAGASLPKVNLASSHRMLYQYSGQRSIQKAQLLQTVVASRALHIIFAFLTYWSETEDIYAALVSTAEELYDVFCVYQSDIKYLEPVDNSSISPGSVVHATD